MAYQPKTGAACGCKRGVERDNCSNCEGTGQVIDFAAIRARGRVEGKRYQVLWGGPFIAPPDWTLGEFVTLAEWDTADADQNCDPLMSGSYPERGLVARSEVDALPVNGVIDFNAGAGGNGSIKRIA